MRPRVGRLLCEARPVVQRRRVFGLDDTVAVRAHLVRVRVRVRSTGRVRVSMRSRVRVRVRVGVRVAVSAHVDQRPGGLRPPPPWHKLGQGRACRQVG